MDRELNRSLRELSGQLEETRKLLDRTRPPTAIPRDLLRLRPLARAIRKLSGELNHQTEGSTTMPELQCDRCREVLSNLTGVALQEFSATLDAEFGTLTIVIRDTARRFLIDRTFSPYLHLSRPFLAAYLLAVELTARQRALGYRVRRWGPKA